MKKTIIGIIFFLMQISLALFYGPSIDVIIIAALAFILFIYVVYNYKKGKYDSCEI